MEQVAVMKNFDMGLIAELLHAEVMRCRQEIERLSLMGELHEKRNLEKHLKYENEMRQGRSPVENLLNPEQMFTPMKNIRSDGADQ